MHDQGYPRCPQTKPWPQALFPKLTSDAMRQEDCMYDQGYPTLPTDTTTADSTLSQANL